MIEITDDGPFAEKADQLFPDRVRIVGLGQTGAAACDQLTLHGEQAHDIRVFDTDQQVIEGSIVTNRQLLGRSLVHGLGCNGDLDLAREIVAMEQSRLAHVAHGCDILVLMVGLAGATGVALAEHFITIAHEAGVRVIVIGAQPFAFEGWARREKSVSAIAALRREADSVLVLSHDRLADNAATTRNIRHGFHLMHRMLAQVAQALGQIVCKRGLIQLSFADVRSLYGRYTGSEVLENCWAAHVDADIDDHTEDVVAQLMASPFLSDETMWKQIDHAIVAIGGTRDLGLTDVQELVKAIREKLPIHVPIATSASLDDKSHDKVRVTLLFATTAPVPALEEVPQNRPPAYNKTQVLPQVPMRPKAAAATAAPVTPTTAAVPEPTPEAEVYAEAADEAEVPAIQQEQPAIAAAAEALAPTMALGKLKPVIPVQPRLSVPIHAAPLPPKAPTPPSKIPRPSTIEPIWTKPMPSSPAFTGTPASSPAPSYASSNSAVAVADEGGPESNKPGIEPFSVPRPSFTEPPTDQGLTHEPEQEPSDDHSEPPEEEMTPPVAAAFKDEEELDADSEPEPVAHPSSSRASRLKAKQAEMQFDPPPRGRFEQSYETIYNGENLDQPTFRRRGLKIVV